ncbi:MAG TPA: protealysin inhibitor emfourin [Thermoanaerobaculia bacterium]|nr:protealysin inhibitor emfourin [Thermoanaerobaculia bacterium]
MTIRKIRFRQSGGFAGFIRGCELTPESLDSRERAQLERLVERSGLAAKGDAPAPKPASAARDLTNFEIEIETSSGTVRTELDDLDLPPEVAPLVTLLQKHSRPIPLDR